MIKLARIFTILLGNFLKGWLLSGQSIIKLLHCLLLLEQSWGFILSQWGYFTLNRPSLMLYNPVSWINDAIEGDEEQQYPCLVWTLSVILLWVFWLRWNCATVQPPHHPSLPDSGHNPNAKGGVWEQASSHTTNYRCHKASSSQGLHTIMIANKYFPFSAEHRMLLGSFCTLRACEGELMRWSQNVRKRGIQSK